MYGPNGAHTPKIFSDATNYESGNCTYSIPHNVDFKSHELVTELLCRNEPPKNCRNNPFHRRASMVLVCAGYLCSFTARGSGDLLGEHRSRNHPAHHGNRSAHDCAKESLLTRSGPKCACITCVRHRFSLKNLRPRSMNSRSQETQT